MKESLCARENGKRTKTSRADTARPFFLCASACGDLGDLGRYFRVAREIWAGVFLFNRGKRSAALPRRFSGNVWKS